MILKVKSVWSMLVGLQSLLNWTTKTQKNPGDIQAVYILEVGISDHRDADTQLELTINR